MGGKVLEYEAKTIKREGIREGLEQGREQGREQGLQQGLEQGIEGTVSILKNLGVPTQTILVKIQEQYKLSPEASKRFV